MKFSSFLNGETEVLMMFVGGETVYFYESQFNSIPGAPSLVIKDDTSPNNCLKSQSLVKIS